MQRDLQRFFVRNQLVEIIYMDQNGQISKRMIRLLAIAGDTVKAYCFTRKAKRHFVIDRILAAVPATQDQSSAAM
ncbi:UNVERIFIED_CONTAM: putative DNA-binding transcriptional regulator YafY [Brevibacillus sp. OAP136]